MNTKALILAAATAGLFSVAARATDTTGPAGAPTTDTNAPCPACGHSPQAATAWHEKALAAYDLDKNGRLDPEERVALKKAVDAGKFEKPPPGALARPRAARHAERERHGPRSPEMKAWHEKALAAYDLDKNGRLDPEERVALKKAVDAGKFEKPPFAMRPKHHPHGSPDNLPPPPPPPANPA